jgi:hypothetical protein
VDVDWRIACWRWCLLSTRDLSAPAFTSQCEHTSFDRDAVVRACAGWCRCAVRGTVVCGVWGLCTPVDVTRSCSPDARAHL